MHLSWLKLRYIVRTHLMWSMKHNDRLIQTNTASSTFSYALPHSCSYRARNTSALTRLVALALTQHIAVLLERAAHELLFGPQVRREEAVGTSDGDEGSLERILERLGGTGGCAVDVRDTGELEQTLDGWGGDKAGTAWSWDELYRVSN